MKIVVLDGYGLNPGDLSWQGLQALGEVTIYDRTAPDDVVHRAEGAEIILTNKTVLTAGTIMSLPKLKYIGVLATGYNVVDTEAAKTQHIVVTNIPAYSTESVAQMVFAHILNITNQVGYYATENRNGRWSRNLDFCYWDQPLTELSGKKIGIIGLGNTGQATARIALAFGMKVYAYTSKEQQKLPAGITKCSLDELFATCDIISLHCPLNHETRHIINTRRLEQMKADCIVINTGRGPLVNEQDMANALNNGMIRAFGTDVLCMEPADPNNPLLTAKNSFITPHIAWATKEARERLMDICLQNIKAFINGTSINVVNQ